ncbi:hypothetical protein WDU94_002263 [Cyamophila willieti]
MASVVPTVAVRGSTGISINHGPPSYELVSAFHKDESKSCKAMLFSPLGEYFAWLNGKEIQIASTSTWKVIAKIDRPKAFQIEFSPKGTYILSWEQFSVSDANPQGSPNLNIYKAATGEFVKAFMQKKNSNWAPHWTPDESICARLVNSELQFYKVPDFESIVTKVTVPNIHSFSLSPENDPFHVLCYVVGKAGQPSAGRLFQYPNIDLNAPLANKSFFQADKVDMLWNKKGSGVLLLVSTDVDKTNASYYGKQSLHFISTKGETALVVLGKEGPIYEVEWSPSSVEFCVIYGFMPAKATLYNLKCEPVFEFGQAPRNTIHFNPQGNILLLGGFGNLNGNVETWDVRQRKLIAKLDAPDTTLLHWSPNGEHFMTATTAPRLRTGNGFKIWHYSGALLYERPWNKQEELWEVLWQRFSPTTFRPPTISYKPVEGIQSSQPLPSKQAYVPPSQRGRDVTFRLRDENDEITGISNDINKSKLPPGLSQTSAPGSGQTKASIKLKKKREAKKAAKQQAENNSDSQNKDSTTNGNVEHSTSKPASGAGAPREPRTGATAPSFNRDGVDPEVLKKIKKVRASLNQIQKLKEAKAAGKQLEVNQMNKIDKEGELTKELNSLLVL